MENENSVSYKRSLVIGTLLGDATSRRRDTLAREKAELAVSHGLGQADLVEWKASEIRRLYGASLVVHYDRERNRVGFSLSRGRRLRVIHDWFHRCGKKVITDKVRFMDHPVGLSMLLCDDGSVRRRKKEHRDGSVYYLKPSLTIATHCYDVESVDKLLRHIQVMCGAMGYINPARRTRAGERVAYNRVNFNSENSKKLWSYVKNWIPRVPSMLSKFSFAIEHYGIN